MMGIDSIASKLRGGERLDFEDAVLLFRNPNLYALGRLADEARRRRHGRAAYYVRNVHLNYTNVCVFDCHFCSFYRKEGQAGAWEMDLPTVFAYAARARRQNLSEVHIVGGVHPRLPYSYYLEMLRGLKERYPELHLKAFTATEIDHLSRIAGLPVAQVLRDLKEAGLDSLPGGGAEIFADRVWNQICSGKARPERWLEIHRAAHSLGLRSTATMLYGHIESDEERVDHMLRLRELQDETGGFTAFICWTFQNDGSAPLKAQSVGSSEYLRTLAISRLYLDNFDNLQSSWVTQGRKVGELSLRYGANDMGSTMLEENVVSAAGTVYCMNEGDLHRMARAAGFVPRRRNFFYELL